MACECLFAQDTAKWYDKTYELRGVTIEKKRERYSRKNNPAVELMRKVIAEKKRNDLKRRDYYRRDKYQKMTLAANDLRLSDVTQGRFSSIPGAINQLEVCPYNNKLILPLNIVEKSSADIYRRSPQSRKEIVEGKRSEGINNLFRSGQMMIDMLEDCIRDIDIYDNTVHLFHHDITSPIGNTAISFYRYFIVDTLSVGGAECYKLFFYPNNGRDFGYSGNLYVLADSTYRIRRCELSLPRQSTMNFVEGMMVWQDFGVLDDGGWGVYADDMIIELSLLDFVQKFVLVKKTRVESYSFEPIADSEFSEKTLFAAKRKASEKDGHYWEGKRRVELSHGERRMSAFMDSVRSSGSFRLSMPLLRLLTDDYVSTGSVLTPSKFDFGPVFSTVSHNPIDGYRFRIGGTTTANLSPRFFVDGFYAYGVDSRSHYYRARATYSFCKKDYRADEFPQRSISIESTRDISLLTPHSTLLTPHSSLHTKRSSSLLTNDNVFTSFRWAGIDKMVRYNRQRLSLVREEENGIRTSLALTSTHNHSWGNMQFDYRSTDVNAGVQYTTDNGHIALSHTVGIKDFLGGDHRYNITEASLYARLWLRSWGNIDVRAKGCVQWNSVPYYLLLMPAANLSYISRPGMFALVNNMELLSDRYASVDLGWNLNGKLFNRLPLINLLGWREYIGVRAMWGTLSAKNNPENNVDALPLPDGSYAMDGGKPYVEMVLGIHNILRFFHVEYVRRLTYRDLPTAEKQGVRARLSFEF